MFDTQIISQVNLMQMEQLQETEAIFFQQKDH